MTGSRNGQIRLVTAISASAAVLCAGFATSAEAFVTSSGARISTPTPQRMSCADLNRKLQQIDATGFRGVQPAPRNPSDLPLFDYESKVAGELYARCPSSGMGPVQRSEVFRDGFRN